MVELVTTVETYSRLTRAETAPRGLIGSAPAAPAEAEVQRKYRREPGFPVPILIAPATLWLVVFLFLPLASIFIFTFWKTTVLSSLRRVSLIQIMPIF